MRGNKTPREQLVKTNKQTSNENKERREKTDFPTFNKILAQGPAMPREKSSPTKVWIVPSTKVPGQGGKWG